MTDDSNPYESPAASGATVDPNAEARRIFIGWEKWLRPAYNLVLAWAASRSIVSFTDWGYAIPYKGSTLFFFLTRAVVANILFTAGPLADYYISVLLRKRHIIITAAIFALGTLFSILLVRGQIAWYWTTQYSGLKPSDLDIP